MLLVTFALGGHELPSEIELLLPLVEALLVATDCAGAYMKLSFSSFAHHDLHRN